MAIDRSPYVLLAVALIGVIASSTASGAHPSRTHVAAPAARHHAAPHPVVPVTVRYTRPDFRFEAPRAPVVVRFVPIPRVSVGYRSPVPSPVALASPAYVATGALPPVQNFFSESSAGYPPNWDWTRVDSIAELIPRKALPAIPQIRYYCPDTREYFPAVETCVSPWLKVIP